MKLLDKLNKELEKLDLRFDVEKELNEKYRGKLIDTKINFVLEKMEVSKMLQYDRCKSFAKMCRNMIDMHIKIKELEKQSI